MLNPLFTVVRKKSGSRLTAAVHRHVAKGRSEMMHVPRHVKGVRSVVRDAGGHATRRSGLPVGSAFAMIRKDIQELRRQTSRPQVEPAALEQRLHELAAQIGALQGTTLGSAGLDAFLEQLNGLLAQNLAMIQQQIATSAANALRGPAESIRRDVASLKEIQASVDRRTQDTFEAVYATIERIVDRLAAIEDELREHKPGPQASAPSADERDWPGVPAIRHDLAVEAPALAPADRSGRTVVLRQPAMPDIAFDAAPRREPVRPDSDGRRSQSFVPIGDALAGVRWASQLLANTLKTTTANTAGALVRMTSRPRGKGAMLGISAGLLMLVALAFVPDFYRSPAETPPVPVAGKGSDGDRADGEQVRAVEPQPDRPFPRHEANLIPAPVLAPFRASPPVDGSGPAAAAAVAAAAVPVPADAMRDAD